MQALIRHKLMPENLEQRKALEGCNPYCLRGHGLDKALSLFEFGRVLFHLDQRRGFKSNRKTDKAESKGPIKEASTRLKTLMVESGARTLG